MAALLLCQEFNFEYIIESHQIAHCTEILFRCQGSLARLLYLNLEDNVLP